MDLVTPVLPLGTSADKLLVLGLDGLRWDRIAAAPAPTLQALISGGLFAPSLLDVGSGAPTLSGPGWSTMATGVWPERHGVRDNTLAGARFDAYPDFLTRLKHAHPDLSTFVAVDWPPLVEQGVFSAALDAHVVADGEENGYYVEDERLTAVATRLLRDQDPDAAFVYLGTVDIIGHGWGAMSDQYLDGISKVDGWVGELLAAVRARPARATERWLVLITTDHGHRDEGDHGGFTDAERSTFIIATGDGVAPGRRDDHALVDIATTALHHFGVEPQPGWELAGRSLVDTVPVLDR